ncbi:MAG: type IV secretion system DNA-binding domain-containing protein, partial [Chloroflexi bacterium]|nr:type IV secretion system DNA-binding domain-containing protein [Chloroflexota bacterium]
YYASSKRARAILGQPRSTIDLRRTILDGGVLLVSTAQGAAGKDVAALVGASILNLADAVIREQGELPQERRRGALVVVDEMQSMPGVDYESMLSELGKFGASLVLATQSLAKLDDLSPTMRDTLLANIGCLAVFQVAGSDARQLVWELDRDRVSEEDIVSLPVHHAYVRATVGTERAPAFSMEVLKPDGGSPATAERIREEASAYLLTEEEIAAQRAEGRRRVDLWLEQMAEEDDKKAGAAGEPERNDPDGQAPKEPRGNRQRSKRQPPGDSSGDDAA